MPRALVIGSPIEHSLSPVLHQAGYAAAGLDQWRYARAEVTAATFEQFMTDLPNDVAGISVTMPCKEPALAWAAHTSALAREVGAANTLYRAADGWHADNTDVAGIVQALLGAGLESGHECVILGSGATARSAVAAVAQLGVQRVTFGVRNEARAETVALAQVYDMHVDVVPLVQAAQRIAATDLVVSTLPSHGADAVAQDLARLRPDLAQVVVFDVVYDNWPTVLAGTASGLGAGVVSGLEMLIEQAAVQFELFTGVAAPIADMRAAGHSRVK